MQTWGKNEYNSYSYVEDATVCKVDTRSSRTYHCINLDATTLSSRDWPIVPSMKTKSVYWISEKIWTANTCQRLDKPDTLYSNTRRIARYQLSVLLLLCYCEGWHMLNSAVTVCRRLRSAELRVRWPYFGPFFVSVTSRSQFTLVTASLTVAITTMACCRLWWFHMRNADGRMQVWRRCGERCNNDCVVQTGRLGWGICLGYEKGRMNAEYYNVFPDVIQICTRLGMSMLDCIQHVTLWTSWTETM